MNLQVVHICITGPAKSGKSTIANLIYRMLEDLGVHTALICDTEPTRGVDLSSDIVRQRFSNLVVGVEVCVGTSALTVISKKDA